MMCPVVVQPEAQADLEQAYRWYESQRSGLGREFLQCIEAVFTRISKTPTLHGIAYRNVRQALVKRFPCVVCYLFEEDHVDVVAVFHGHRDPTAWKSRIDEESP